MVIVYQTSQIYECQLGQLATEASCELRCVAALK